MDLNQSTITFPEFLHHILQLPKDWISKNTPKIDDIVQSQQYKETVSKYTSGLGPITQKSSCYHPFIILVNYIMDQLVTDSTPETRICFCSITPVLGDRNSNKKPDVAGVLYQNLELPEECSVNNLMNIAPKHACWWTQLLFFFEFEVSSSMFITEHFSSFLYETKAFMVTVASLTSNLSMLHCASYAQDMMSYSGLRNHVLGALVIDGTVSLLYYDRSINVVSQPLEFLQYPHQFVAMLQALSNLSLLQLGYADSKVIKPSPLLDNPRHALNGLELTLKCGTKLLLGNTLYHQLSLFGNGTQVVQASYLSGGKTLCADGIKPLVVKLSWPPTSRTSEHKIIEKARQSANCPEHYWAMNHLPRVLEQDEHKLQLLSPCLVDHLGSQYEEHVLRILLQEELYPIPGWTITVDLTQSILSELIKCRHLHSVLC